eukprot:3187165-Prymnesium_polylepis.1
MTRGPNDGPMRYAGMPDVATTAGVRRRHTQGRPLLRDWHALDTGMDASATRGDDMSFQKSAPRREARSRRGKCRAVRKGATSARGPKTRAARPKAVAAPPY